MIFQLVLIYFPALVFGFLLAKNYRKEPRQFRNALYFLLLCLFAGVLAIYGYLRWLRNEKAMRLKQDLPYTRGLLIISAILLAVAGVVMVLVFYGG